MADVVMAYVIMAHIVMAYMVMAYIVMACTVMAYAGGQAMRKTSATKRILVIAAYQSS